MIEIFSRQRVKQAILQNAIHIVETLRINSVYTLSFALPYNDPKNRFCTPFSLAKWQGKLYRIMPQEMDISDTGLITYTCEHVIATLIDHALFGYNHVGGFGVNTADVIRWILSKQSDWKLGRCDFSRQFEYGWEQENQLSALFSVPARFSELYMWDYDTETYPWTLHLKKIDLTQIPQLYVRNEKNAIQFRLRSEAEQICTRLYPLGYGEGVNQLTIKGVNNNVAYLQSPKAYTDKYGIIERIWIDRRYEDAASLKEAAQTMLNELQEPYQEYEVDFAELTGGYYDEADLGKIVQLIDNRIGLKQKSYITEIVRSYDETVKSTVTVANKSQSIAATVADMADRQRIEAAYAQGATQLYSQSLQANADKNSGAILDFYIPSEMRIVNKVLLNVRIGQFRAYSKSTQYAGESTQTSSNGGATTQTSTGGGASTQTSSSGGGGTSTSSSGGGGSQTSSSGGGDSKTSSSDGGATVTSASGGQTSTGGSYSWGNSIPTGYNREEHDDEGHHTHLIQAQYLNHYHSLDTHTHSVTVKNHTHTVKIPSHTHNVNIPAHTHSVNIPAHTHSVNIPNHTHNISIPNHTHTVKIPAHSHEITPGIYRFGNPQNFAIYVNGAYKSTIQATSTELDITQYLLSNGKIPRGSWLSVEIRPNDLAYVSLVLFVQGFVQSRGDKTV